MKFLEKEYKRVMRAWKNDQLGYSDAIAELVRLGWNVERAAMHLINH